MQKKLLIKSYGCQMNEYDSAKIADLLAVSHGFVITETLNEADLIILNTCSIRAKAEEKIFSELGRLRSLKKKNPKLILAVGGCVAMQEQKNIFRRAPYVDIIFGPQTLHHLPELYNKILEQKMPTMDLKAPAIEKFNYFPKPGITGSSAYVSIMEGCNKFCSYCIVPYTRGREINRPLSDILSEIKNLTEKGAKQIHLLGQNVNAYYDPKQKITFANLIHEVGKIEAVKIICFTTSHPAEFDNDLINVFATEPKLANQLHLPIQSGSNRILKLMRRGYTKEEYQEIITKIRAIRPNISISTDLIVGFPGETEEDFAQTMETVRTINFDMAFSFIYSPRPNTPAAKMEDNISLGEKKRRLAILQNQLLIQNRQYNQTLIGTMQRVLVNSCSQKNSNQFSGKTENNRMVNFIASENHLGEMVTVEITKILANSLYGKMITVKN